MIMTERVELVWSVTRKSKGVNYQQGFKLHHEPCLIKIGDPASAILNLSVSPPQKLPVKQSRFTKHSPSPEALWRKGGGCWLIQDVQLREEGLYL